jgi:orotate phosphoribosyltransferase
MVLNNANARTMAEYLLEIKAVILSPDKPFTWASGIKSPIYCDNRKTLSHPKLRGFIKSSFADIIHEEFKGVEVIAGVATAGIPHGVLVADVLNLPFIYVRDKAKGHGLENLIEGTLHKGQKVFVIEDLISTGGSSLKAVEAIREAGGEVVGLGAIFSYGFESAESAFKNAACSYFTLSNYDYLIEQAVANNYIKDADVQLLQQWKKSPAAFVFKD